MSVEKAKVADYSKPILKKSVQRAREELQKRAMEIVEQHLQTINDAAADGKYEFALEAQRWLIEHISDDDGVRVIDPSVDKTKVEERGPVGPQVQINMQLGGIQPKDLPKAPTPIQITEAKVEPITIVPEASFTETD